MTDLKIDEMTPRQRIDSEYRLKVPVLPEKVNCEKTDLLLASEVTRIPMKVK